jgi:tetratricopeptide (TPR) repeat protein
MLWPGVSESQAQHGLRQVLYKLKTLGATIKADRSALILAPRFCTTDFAPMLAPHAGSVPETLTDTIGGSFLPGYRPQFSEDYATWLERQRDVVHSAVARTCVAGIQVKKRVSDWNGAEKLAAMCLAMDPLNEEATLTCAEAAALGGSKTKALSILNHYLQDIGEDAGEIKLPAVMLRRRISEAFQDNVSPVRDAPFVGREEEMAELTRALARAQSGQGSAYVIWGESGIGKTRLVSEFTRVASLQRVHIVRVECQSHDERRPLSAFIDIMPKLLALPGALGCSPESMNYLRRLTERQAEGPQGEDNARRSEGHFEHIREAIVDLLDAISSERCAILQFDDSQWLDEYSRSVLESLARRSSTTRLLILANRTSELNPTDQTSFAKSYAAVHLRPLRFDASAALVAHSTSNRTQVTQDFRDWCARSGCGNPLFTLELAKHTDDDGSLAPPPSLAKLLDARLASLSPLSRRLLQVSCVLGRHSSMSVIEDVLRERRVLLYDCLDELESRGIVEHIGEQITSSHALITAAALNQASAVTRALLHRHAARAIETLATRSVTNLWDCAEHWRQAGDDERAVALLTECATLSMGRGLPLEAATMFESAADLAEGEMRSDLIRKSASAFLTAGDCNKAELQALRRVEWLEQIPSTAEIRATAELFYLTIAASNYSFSSDIIERLLGIATRDAALIPDRFEAVLAVLIAADNLCDRDLAERAYRAFAELDSQRLPSCAQREHCLLVYHSSFGDSGLAILAAERLLEFARESSDYLNRPKYIEHAGHVFRVTGDVQRARALYQEAFEYSIAHHVYFRIEAAAVSLLGLALASGDLIEARRWCAIIREQVSLSLRDSPDSDLESYEAELLIRERQFDKAREMIDSLQSYVDKLASVHAKSRHLALRAFLKLRTTGALSKRECRELESIYQKLSGSLPRDFLVVQIIGGMRSLHREEDATRFLSKYLDTDRRSRAPLSPDLRELHEWDRSNVMVTLGS